MRTASEKWSRSQVHTYEYECVVFLGFFWYLCLLYLNKWKKKSMLSHRRFIDDHSPVGYHFNTSPWPCQYHKPTLEVRKRQKSSSPGLRVNTEDEVCFSDEMMTHSTKDVSCFADSHHKLSRAIIRRVWQRLLSNSIKSLWFLLVTRHLPARLCTQSLLGLK